MPFQLTHGRNPTFCIYKFYACIIGCSVFVKTTKTAYQLKSNEVTVASINLTDELVILLIFLNNEHFANTVGKVLHAEQMRLQMLRGQGFGAI